jgi:5-methylcytosine-specific restriction endonuclease McrA
MTFLGKHNARIGDFLEWLAKQARRSDPIGDLAFDVHRKPPPAELTTVLEFRRWVYQQERCLPAVQAVTEAALEWRKVKQAVSLRTRFLVLERDGFRCQLCGRQADGSLTLEVDHKTARAAGGSSSIDNLWTLCFDCNRGKQDSSL